MSFIYFGNTVIGDTAAAIPDAPLRQAGRRNRPAE